MCLDSPGNKDQQVMCKITTNQSYETCIHCGSLGLEFLHRELEDIRFLSDWCICYQIRSPLLFVPAMMYWQVQASHFLLSPGCQINNGNLWAEILDNKAEAVAENLGTLPQSLIFRGESQHFQHCRDIVNSSVMLRCTLCHTGDCMHISLGG